MRKILKGAFALVLAGIMTVGCTSSNTPTSSSSNNTTQASSEAPTDKKLKIGVAMMYKGDEWLSGIADEFEKQCKEKGFECNIQDANLDNEKQVQQIENFISQKYDIIVIDAVNAEGIIPVVQKAQDAKIPVFAIDTLIEHPHVSTTVTWDNFATGVKLGEYVDKYVEENFKDKDSLNLVMINAPSYPHLVKRDEGFLSIINKNSKIKIIATQDAGGSREISANIINNNIAKGIDLVYGVVDNHAWGAVTALEEANAEGSAVFSCGGFGSEPFQALENNHKYYKALIVVPPANIVKTSLEVIDKIVKGETIDKLSNIEFGLADSKNVKDFIK